MDKAAQAPQSCEGEIHFEQAGSEGGQHGRLCQYRRCQLFPLSDVVVIPYLTSLKSEGKRSAILDTVETVHFLHHVLGVAIEKDLLKHPWVLGLVRTCEQARPTLKQARVLTAREVLSLETLFIEGSLHEVDRFGLGCFLFLIFACCRLSDVSYLDSLALDVPDKALRSDNPGFLYAS